MTASRVRIICTRLAAVGWIVAAPVPGHADGSRASSASIERIAYAQGDVVWAIAASGEGDPVELVRLPADHAPVERIVASDNGRVLVVVTQKGVLWAKLPASRTATARPLACGGPAHLSRDGNRIACADAAGQAVVYDLRPRVRSRTIDPRGVVLGFLDEDGVALAVATAGSRAGARRSGRGNGGGGNGGDAGGEAADGGGEVWRVPVLTPAKRTRLAPHRPRGPIQIAPDGSRAVGSYPNAGRDKEGRHDESAPALYGFRLDGKGTRRRLIEDGEPIAWSHDGRWVLVQTKRHACMIRAVGGQYKCWRGYRAVGFAPDANHVLLSRVASDARDGAPANLYRGARNGTRASRPSLIRERAGDLAVWLPARR